MKEEKEYLDKYDIAKMYNCGLSKAMDMIRGIKSISDTLGYKGRITKLDLERWQNRNKEPITSAPENDDLKELLLTLFKSCLSEVIKKELSTHNHEDLKVLSSVISNRNHITPIE